MKMFEILQKLPKCDKVSKCCWKNDTYRFVGHRAAINLQLIKELYPQRAIKLSTIKRNVPAFWNTVLTSTLDLVLQVPSFLTFFHELK